MGRTRFSLHLVLALWGVAAFAVGTHALPQAKGFHTDKRFGFKFKAPRDWTQIPVAAQEEWLVAKYLSAKKYFYTEKGGGGTYEHQPELMVIAFVDEVTKNKGKKVSEVDGETRITFQFDNPYKDYEDYLDRTYTGGGFYISDREESKVGDVAVTKLEIKVEKLARGGPKRITTWIYHAPDVDFAVQVEVLENHFDKLKRTITGALRSFKLIPRTEGALPTEAGARGSWIAVFDMDKGTPDERRKKREESARQIREKAVAKLPEDWTAEQMGRVFVISHVDPKDAKKTASHANALLDWMDETFAYVGPEEYVRTPIIRICKDDEEESSFRRGGGGFYFGLEIVTNGGVSWFGDFKQDQMNSRLLRIWFQDRDRDLYWAMPEWLDYGLSEYVKELRFKGKKTISKADDWDRDGLRQLVRDEKASSPRKLILMSGEDFRDGEAFWNRFDEAGALVRFFMSPAARKKKQTKTILADYIKNLAAVTREIEEEEDKKDTKFEKPETEEEEEKLYKARQERWKKKERQILDETFARTFAGWSDRDWKTVEKAYFASID